MRIGGLKFGLGAAAVLVCVGAAVAQTAPVIPAARGRARAEKDSATKAASVAAPVSTSAVSASAVSASVAHLTINPGEIAAPVSPMLYGLMTEEINHSYDGGLYAELVQNRSFSMTWAGAEHWGLVRHGNAQVSMKVDKTDGPSKALAGSMKLTVDAASAGNEAGLSNPGYWGMALKGETRYRGSFWAKSDGGEPVKARLVSDRTGKVLAEAMVEVGPGPWAEYKYTLTTGVMPVSTANHLELTVSKRGTIWLQLVSLMPPTFHGRPNGNRADLMERMAAMHPKFLRLPGGNYLEGDRLEDWYNWKETIGPLVDRPGHQAPWTYRSSDGLGLLEFLEWCEDLKIEPLLAVYAGYALQGQHVAAGKDMEPYVQAALDEIEYVTGGPNTKWGARRAKDGHPSPFPLHYVEIGNEDWLDRSGSYEERFPVFAKAIREKYPQYKIIATTPLKGADAQKYVDVIDDHYYKAPHEMMDFVKHYDDAPRNGPKIFVGEWATRSGVPTPNFGDALGDAAWMTAMERNSDLIIMAAYAPMLVNVNPGGMQWATDLIGFDGATTYASPSYWAQSLFATHLGDGTARSSVTGAGARFFYSATVSSGNRMLHLKLVNASDQDQPLTVDLTGVTGTKSGTMTTLHGASYEATNSITDPNFIKPVGSLVQVSATGWKHTVPALTIEVMDLPLR